MSDWNRLKRCARFTLWVWLVCLCVQPLSAATQGKLYWKNGDVLPGELLEASDGRLRWSSSVFDRPLLLETKELESMVLESAKLKAAEAFRVRTTGGDVLVADLISVEKDELVFRSKRHGQFRIKRAAISKLTRVNHPDLMYLGPNGLAGWSSIKEGENVVMSWAEGREGHLSTQKKGTGLFRSFEWPEVLQVECSVSSSTRSGFVLALGTPVDKAIRIETWQDELVVVCGNQFEPLKVLAKGDANVTFRLVYRASEGQLDVFDRAGKRLGGLQKVKNEVETSGIYFRSRSDQLTLNRLEVRRGASKSHVLPPLKEGRDQVHLIDGQVVDGVLGDSAVGEPLKIIHGDQVTQVPVDQVDRIVRAAKLVAPGHQVYLVYHDGSRISGKLQSIGPKQATLQAVYSDKPLAAQIEGVQKIWLGPKTKSQISKSTLDKLYCDAGKLHGRLIGGRKDGAPVQWRPTGGVESVGLAVGADARIVRAVERGAKSHDPKRFGDVVYLQSQEVIPCRVISVDDKFIKIQSAFSGADQIAVEQLKAIELSDDPRMSLVGFGDPGWQVVARDRKTVDFDADRAILKANSVELRHENILRGRQIEFTTRWAPASHMRMSVRLFADDVTNTTRAKTFSVYFTNQTGRVYYYDGQNGQRVSSRTMIPLQGGTARCRIQLDGQQLKFMINDRLAMTAPIIKGEKLGRGLVFRVDYIRSTKNAPTQLTISDFQIAGSAILDDETLDLALTVPRFSKDQPPKHLLVAHNGDLLRGKLLAVNDGKVLFESKLRRLAIPRARVAAIVTVGELDKPDPSEKDKDEKPAPKPGPAPDGPEVHALLNGGGSLRLTPTEMTTDRLLGHSKVLGESALPLAAIRELKLGNIESSEKALPFYAWNLKPIKKPQFEDMGDVGEGSKEEPLVGQVVEALELQGLDGKVGDLSNDRGKVVILDFWATWCVHCARSIPKYLKLMEKYDADQVRFLAINQGEGRALIEAYLKRREWKMDVVLDERSIIGKKFGAKGLPHLVVIDQVGKVRSVQTGFADGSEKKLEALVDDLIKNKPKAEPAPQPKPKPAPQPIF